MSSESNFSWNFREEGLTVRGDTFNEFKLNLSEVADGAALLLDLLAHIKGAAATLPVVNVDVKSNPFPSNAGPWQQPPVQQYTPPAAPQNGPLGESCRHGQMTFRSGTSKTTGKPYSGYFCPNQDRNDQCPPKFSGR